MSSGDGDSGLWWRQKVADTSVDSFYNVGIGSSGQDFVGDDSRTRSTSSCCSGNDNDDVENDVGSGQ